MDILFELDGDSMVLGNIDVLLVVIYGIFSFYLFSSFEKTEEFRNQKEEVEEEKPKQEEANKTSV